ncbi:SIS domain-containing protein [Numidum massiliense]|uniref:SIS domain-containing protein n=1 Tax=Numidum massiliense TaxID=1522315 RepID=UPI0006D5A5D7|nr:SIS domain-containing protein [Numidum massiliense]
MTNHTYTEIKRQPMTWQKTIDTVLEQRDKLRQFFQDHRPDEVIFTGCGTSYYISIAAAMTFTEQTGIAAKAAPASEVFLKPDAVFAKNRRTVIVGSSRSGNTSEVVRALRFAAGHQLAQGLSVTANPDSDMAKQTPHSVVLPHVQEKSVVMTSSFTNLLLASQLIASIVADDEDYLAELQQLPQLGEQTMPQAEALAQKLGREDSYDHYIYLGLGAAFGLACEAMLKMKEMTQLFAEAFNPLEFRHGPISVLNERCRAFVLSNRTMSDLERDVVSDVRKYGANVVAIGDAVSDFSADEVFDLASGLTDPSRSVLYLPLLQLTAYYRTEQMGLNPDRPRNLNQVVVLKDEGGN